MIARDAAATLPACLASVAAVADEMVVVDTGSSDDTAAVAREHGARVIPFRWCDDFAAARNAYVRAARGSWVLSLDADEVLDPVDREGLRAVLAANPRTACVVTVRNYFALGELNWPYMPSEFLGEVSPGIGCMTSRTIRLFPRATLPEYRFPVHESLVPSLRHRGVAIRHCRLGIHHTGYLGGRGEFEARAALYGRLGERKLELFPRHPLAHLELGRVRLFEGEIDDAARLFRNCIRLRPRLVPAHFFYVLALAHGGHSGEAHGHLARALELMPGDPDLLYLRGLLALESAGPEAVAADLAPALRRMSAGAPERAQMPPRVLASASSRSDAP
ncbi:MAG TPA: glycosyltransferase [Thermoleophilaceae bacterium]|jgi:glycosyltransferase involved in cell wall biosynthesis